MKAITIIMTVSLTLEVSKPNLMSQIKDAVDKNVEKSIDKTFNNTVKLEFDDYFKITLEKAAQYKKHIGFRVMFNNSDIFENALPEFAIAQKLNTDGLLTFANNMAKRN